MNFGSNSDKHEEVNTAEWMNKLQSVHVTRADMNNLIMNYLVTGKSQDNQKLCGHFLSTVCYDVYCASFSSETVS